MVGNRQYDHEYKVQAVKLAKEIGQAKTDGYMRTVLAILILELAHRLHKVP